MATTKVLMNFAWSKKNKHSDITFTTDKKEVICDSILKVAKKELREDNATREQALEQFRDWLKKNYDVENVRTDDAFLLRFLRNKKFSVPMAQQQLLKYLNFRKVMQHLFCNLDFLGKGVANLINNGYIMASPIRDKYGRRTLLYFANGLNGVEYSQVDQVKAHFIAYEILMESQKDQIMGVVHIGDFRGATTDHVSLWHNPIELMKLLKWGEQSIPLRHKEIRFYNVPFILKYIIDAGKGIVTSKIRDRIHVHVSADEMKKQVCSVDVLPKELGGKIPMAEMLEMWKIELAENRNTILALDKMSLLNDQGIIGRRNIDRNNNAVSKKSDQVIGSFRKLEID